MKKILVSSALSALMVLPVMADVSVYDDKGVKVDVYGSLRAFAGGGADLRNTTEGGSKIKYGSILMGVQDNSQLGFKVSKGAFKFHLQFGASEAGLSTTSTTSSPGIREFWASYGFGPLTILAGKATAPAVDTGYVGNWFNTDNGMKGFGGNHTGDRKMQVQLHIAGAKIAIIEDDVGVLGNSQSTTTAFANATPRLSFAYEMKGDNAPVDFKVGGNYKHYNSNGTTKELAGDTDAWNIMAALKAKLGGGMYVSVLANAGQNAWMYGALDVMHSTGGYKHNSLGGNLVRNMMIYGGVATFGMKFTNELGFAVGAGYQHAGGGESLGAKNLATYDSWGVFANLPYEFTKGVSIVPQIAYYSTTQGSTAAGSRNTYRKGAVAAIRFKYDF